VHVVHPRWSLRWRRRRRTKSSAQRRRGVSLSWPGLARSIPVIGDLFKQRVDKVTRAELIVLITPRVIRRSIELENITRQMRGMTHIRR
jgi:general secretion pathway protein D